MTAHQPDADGAAARTVESEDTSVTGLAEFLAKTVAVSLSGVMAPGPVTAATLAAGTRSRHAGFLMAVGHGIVELPLMLLVVAGANRLLAVRGVTVTIGLLGGAFLLWMGAQMLRDIRKADDDKKPVGAGNPLWIGIMLTAGNPYFLMWWVFVGLALATQAVQLGPAAFALFALVHWLCDVVWLEALSWSSFKGTRLFGPRSRGVVLGICGAALIVVGAMFILDAARGTVARPAAPQENASAMYGRPRTEADA